MWGSLGAGDWLGDLIRVWVLDDEGLYEGKAAWTEERAWSIAMIFLNGATG